MNDFSMIKQHLLINYEKCLDHINFYAPLFLGHKDQNGRFTLVEFDTPSRDFGIPLRQLSKKISLGTTHIIYIYI